MNAIERAKLEQWKADMQRWSKTSEAWIPVGETKQEQKKRIAKAIRDYSFFVRTYFPDIARTPCGKFHIEAAKYILNSPHARAVFEWARGHAKSTQLGVFVPMWLMIQPTLQFHTLVYVSKSEDAAKQLLSDL